MPWWALFQPNEPIYFSSHEMNQCCFGDAAVTGGIESLKLYSWTLGFCDISWECTDIQVCLQFGFNSTCFRVLVVDVHIIYLEIWKDLGNKLMISKFRTPRRLVPQMAESFPLDGSPKVSLEEVLEFANHMTSAWLCRK